MKKASIIIPTLNEEKYIFRLLTNLKNQKNVDLEIIIVDGNSKDKTINIAKQISRKITIFKIKPNIANQRNLGIRKSINNLIFLFDADVGINSDFISNSIKKFEDKKLDIACPKYIPVTQNVFIKFIYKIFNFVFYIGQKRYPSGAGSCIIIKKSVFSKHKGFNNKIIYDDIEFIRKVSKSNNFGIINENVFVSDRRFKKYGILKTLITYLKLSYYFSKSDYQVSNKNIEYKFGDY